MKAQVGSTQWYKEMAEKLNQVAWDTRLDRLKIKYKLPYNTPEKDMMVFFEDERTRLTEKIDKELFHLQYPLTLKDMYHPFDKNGNYHFYTPAEMFGSKKFTEEDFRNACIAFERKEPVKRKDSWKDKYFMSIDPFDVSNEERLKHFPLPCNNHLRMFFPDPPKGDMYDLETKLIDEKAKKETIALSDGIYPEITGIKISSLCTEETLRNGFNTMLEADRTSNQQRTSETGSEYKHEYKGKSFEEVWGELKKTIQTKPSGWNQKDHGIQ